MLDPLFVIKTLLSFVVGGLAVAIALWAGEKFGGRVTGIIIGLPVVSAVGLFFIGFTQSAVVASQATTVMPITLAGGLIFLLIFAHLFEKFGLFKSILSSVLAFFIVTGFAVIQNLTDIYINGVIYLFIFGLTLIVVKNFPKIKLKKSSGKKQFLLRSIFAGTIVATSVIVALYAGPYWGGVIAAFPASYFSTAIISTRANGIEFTKAVIKGVPLATIGSMLYYLIAYWTYPIYDIYIGTIAGYIIAITFMLLVEKAKPIIKTQPFLK